MLRQRWWQKHPDDTLLCFPESSHLLWHSLSPCAPNDRQGVVTQPWAGPQLPRPRLRVKILRATLHIRGHMIREPHLNYLEYNTRFVLPSRFWINESSAERLLSRGEGKEKASRRLPIIEAIELVPKIVEKHSQSSGDAMPSFCKAEVSLDRSCTCKGRQKWLQDAELTWKGSFRTNTRDRNPDMRDQLECQ